MYLMYITKYIGEYSYLLSKLYMLHILILHRIVVYSYLLFTTAQPTHYKI